MKTQGRLVRQMRMEMGKIMDDNVGPFRDGKSLEKARLGIAKLQKEPISVSEHSHVFNAELQSGYELWFMLELARCNIISAIERKESRGGQTRAQSPHKGYDT